MVVALARQLEAQVAQFGQFSGKIGQAGVIRPSADEGVAHFDVLVEEQGQAAFRGGVVTPRT